MAVDICIAGKTKLYLIPKTLQTDERRLLQGSREYLLCCKSIFLILFIGLYMETSRRDLLKSATVLSSGIVIPSSVALLGTAFSSSAHAITHPVTELFLDDQKYNKLFGVTANWKIKTETYRQKGNKALVRREAILFKNGSAWASAKYVIPWPDDQNHKQPYLNFTRHDVDTSAAVEQETPELRRLATGVPDEIVNGTIGILGQVNKVFSSAYYYDSVARINGGFKDTTTIVWFNHKLKKWKYGEVLRSNADALKFTNKLADVTKYGIACKFIGPTLAVIPLGAVTFAYYTAKSVDEEPTKLQWALAIGAALGIALPSVGAAVSFFLEARNLAVIFEEFYKQPENVFLGEVGDGRGVWDPISPV
jgi:hypothetical protein